MATDRRIPRGELEFDRVAFFTDAVYAIAITVIAIEIGVPVLSNADSGRELLDALREQLPEIISFFISFAVLGNFWLAHNGFFRKLGAVDAGLIRINLAYLALVAIVPFPTVILGNYDHNPVAVALYAVTIAPIGALEVAMFRRAWRRELFARPWPAPVYRWALIGSSLPVAFFLASIPIAFVNAWLGIAVWFLSPLSGIALARSKPEGADEIFD